MKDIFSGALSVCLSLNLSLFVCKGSLLSFALILSCRLILFIVVKL